MRPGYEPQPLMQLAQVRAAARRARDAGATRFCLGAAYRAPKARDISVIADMIREVRALGLETCATLGMLEPEQAHTLKQAGLDYYNHNLDTSSEFYGQIISTRTYQDRLDTLSAVRAAGLKVCCGGIVGLGESAADRAELLRTLANLPEHPESVPMNQLVRVPGTPLADGPQVDPFDFVRTIAVARLLMPRAQVRLSAGREAMSDELQALCFLAGANSIFYGEKLLTTGNPDVTHDQQLFTRLGLTAAARAGSRVPAGARGRRGGGAVRSRVRCSRTQASARAASLGAALRGARCGAAAARAADGCGLRRSRAAHPRDCRRPHAG